MFFPKFFGMCRILIPKCIQKRVRQVVVELKVRPTEQYPYYSLNLSWTKVVMALRQSLKVYGIIFDLSNHVLQT